MYLREKNVRQFVKQRLRRRRLIAFINVIRGANYFFNIRYKVSASVCQVYVIINSSNGEARPVASLLLRTRGNRCRGGARTSCDAGFAAAALLAGRCRSQWYFSRQDQWRAGGGRSRSPGVYGAMWLAGLVKFSDVFIYLSRRVGSGGGATVRVVEWYYCSCSLQTDRSGTML